jgi:hypothetical protein
MKRFFRSCKAGWISIPVPFADHHDPLGQELQVVLPKEVGQAVTPHDPGRRIKEKDLQVVPSGRIAPFDGGVVGFFFICHKYPIDMYLMPPSGDTANILSPFGVFCSDFFGG